MNPYMSGLDGFFDVEEVTLFGKVVLCVKTAGFVYFYFKSDEIINALLTLLKDDIKDEIPVDIIDLVQTFMLPSVGASIVTTSIALIRSKKYHALNSSLGLSAMAYGAYRVYTKFDIPALVAAV